MRNYARSRQFRTTEFVDFASGAREDRPRLAELMAAARRRDIDAVVVWRFDRFARSVKQLVLALEEFRSLGVDFISLQEQIDTSSPMGRAMFHVIAAMAELERSLIGERTQAGMARARAQGKTTHRPRKIVRIDRMVKLRAAGLSLGQIAGELKLSKSMVARRLAEAVTQNGASK